MSQLIYLLVLVRDNLAWIALVAGIIFLFAPYRAWTLLRNNRPGRSSGWKMWLADRYIQIWLAKRPLPSGETPYELRMPTGMGDTVMDRKIHQKTIDDALLRYRLIIRSEGQVQARRDTFFFLHNWMVCVLCKWYLIVFLGDSPKYYEEISAPLSKVEKIAKKFGLKIFELVYLFLVLILMLAFLRFIFAPFMLLCISLVLKHLPVSNP